MPSDRPRSTTVQSVDRAVSLLQALAGRGAAGLTELAEDVGVHKSTAFRLLATLEARGFVEQGDDRGRYRLGRSVSALASHVHGGQDLVASSRAVVRELAAEVGETVNLAVLDGDGVVTVDQSTSGAIVVIADWVGRRGPLHATAAGKVLLAAAGPERRAEVLARPLPAFTEATVTDPVELERQLREVDERGWATSFEEHEVGLVVVGAPVHDAGGEVAGALTVGGPTYRIDADTLPTVTAQLLEAAKRISWRLGSVKRD